VITIGIIGFGALGRQILDLLDLGSGGQPVLLFDDAMHDQGAENSFPFDSFLDERFAECVFYVGLGYRHLPLKAQLIQRLRSAGRRVPPLVHGSCSVHPTSSLGDGCILYPLCNVGAHVALGEGALLNNSVVVSHESRVGSSAYLSPGVVLSGRVTVGEAAFLGTGVLVADQRVVGRHARVGIGTVVTRDVPDGASVIGNPMRVLDRPLELD
jgi:sugar O-acyltransferase (sialic acid O-acetyltransferase NeuD family)